jgi:biopolymer transport protein TolQ
MIFDSFSKFFINLPASPIDSVTKEGIQNIAGQTATQQGSAVMDFSFFSFFWQSDMVIKGIVFLLIIASIWSWSIILEKSFKLKTLKKRILNFEEKFWSGISLNRFHDEIRGKENHPLAYVFSAALSEWEMRSNTAPLPDNIAQSIKKRLSQSMQIAHSKSIDSLQHNLSFLATVSSTAPFIGLFGTVWGIMVSLQSIATFKSANLAVVAPGMAEALMVTAIGLAVAIPAAIFYNRFTSEINRLANKTEDFSLELHNIIARELENQMIQKPA